jgi:hypothetical protein
VWIMFLLNLSYDKNNISNIENDFIAHMSAVDAS